MSKPEIEEQKVRNNVVTGNRSPAFAEYLLEHTRGNDPLKSLSERRIQELADQLAAANASANYWYSRAVELEGKK